MIGNRVPFLALRTPGFLVVRELVEEIRRSASLVLEGWVAGVEGLDGCEFPEPSTNSRVFK